MEINHIKRVLVVDDDPVQVKLLEGTLKENNFEVIISKDAPDGLQLAMNEQPDLIVLDVMMPIINGYNFCKLIKSEDKTKDIAIIMVTSRDEMEDIEIGLEVGADAYLAKPIDIKELLKAIRIVDDLKGKETSSDSGVEEAL